MGAAKAKKGRKVEAEQVSTVEDRKYEFTGETKGALGVTLHRIRSVRAFGLIAAGTLGGWIESERNLSQVSGNAWVYGDAQVSGDARVYGPVIIATRSDGYTFTLVFDKNNVLRVIAGCRYFDMKGARSHWEWRAGTPLGDETDSILDHFERMAKAGALGTAPVRQEAAE